jgi:hypothetical protein
MQGSALVSGEGKVMPHHIVVDVQDSLLVVP